MVAHYGRQAEPDGRISKQPIVYINHANSTCPQPASTMPSSRFPDVPVKARGGAAGRAGKRPRGDATTVAGDAPLP